MKKYFVAGTAALLLFLGVTPPASAVTLREGPWVEYQRNFRSYETCNKRGADLMVAYGQKIVGGISRYSCHAYEVSACPPQTRWALLVKYWYEVGGPLATGPRVDRGQGNPGLSAAARPLETCG